MSLSLLLAAALLGADPTEPGPARPATPPAASAAAEGTKADQPQPRLTNGQGEMAGEVTATSALLQSRLTMGDRLIDGDLPGAKGIAVFRYATSAEGLKDEDCSITDMLHATPKNDYLVRARLTGLRPNTTYYYQLVYGPPPNRDAVQQLSTGPVRSFKTLPAARSDVPVDFIVIACMNYAKFHGDDRIDNEHHKLQNNIDYSGPYKGADKVLGFPGLVAMTKLNPEFVVATGDNVYYDTPVQGRAKTQAELRQKWHEQFAQQRFIDLLGQTATYWEKDDHDFRYDDSDNTSPEVQPSPELGISTFLEQVPIGLLEEKPKTYRTFRVGKNLQFWLVEGRDYRSPNAMPDGPGKTLWGQEQLEWLKMSLTQSDATFKILISPTPMVGPDDARKTDNATNIGGFQHEREEFFNWLVGIGVADENFYLICGDRHWQYHSIDPRGIEEFGCGSLVDENSRFGREPGDPKSTDPDAKIKQPYIQQKPSGGFLRLIVKPAEENQPATLTFRHYNDLGETLYEVVKPAR